MRTTKKITITDNGNNYDYFLTKMSALSLQKWSERAFSVLIETGVLKQQATSPDFLSNLKDLAQNFNGDILDCLGKLNCDKLDDLIIELIGKTAERMAGASKIKVTETDLEATLEDISSLLELEKECLFINFPIFAGENQSISQQPSQTEKSTTKPRTLIRPSQS